MRALSLLLLLFTATVGAQSRAPNQTDVDDFMRRTAGVELDNTVYRAKGKTLEEGVCSWRFDSGVFVPIYAGEEDKRLVGLVFIGEGEMTVRFPTRGEAWAFANHMDVRTEQGLTDFGPVGRREEAYKVPIRQGVMFSADSRIRKLLVGLDPIGAGMKITEEDMEGVDMELVITGRQGKLRARVVAEDLLPDRRRLLVRGGQDPVVMLARDRLLGEGLGLPDDSLGFVGDFQTTRRYAVALLPQPQVGSTADDQWLTCMRDGSGVQDFGRRQIVFAHGEDPQGIYHRHTFSSDGFGVPGPVAAGPDGFSLDAPAPRVKAVHAETTVVVDPSEDRLTMGVSIESTVELMALEDGVRHLILGLPQQESLDPGFEVISLTLADGTHVPWAELSTEQLDAAIGPGRENPVLGRVDPEQANQPPGTGVDPATVGIDGERRNNQTVLQLTAEEFRLVAVLPRAYAQGESLRLRLRWLTHWPYANFGTDGTSLGVSTGFRSVVPRLLPRTTQSAWAFTTTVGIPKGRRRMPDVAVSGDTLESWTDDERKWVRAAGVSAPRPGVALGRWKSESDPGSPELVLHMFMEDLWALDEYPTELRRALDFFEALIGPIPVSELEIYQGPLATVGGGKLPGHGLGEVERPIVTPTPEQQAERLFKQPRSEHITAARQLGMQYFGQLIAPAGERNAWIATALPDAYASFYLREVFGDDWYWRGLDFVRHALEDEREREDTLLIPVRRRQFASQTAPGTASFYYNTAHRFYGLYLTAVMLPEEVGWKAYLEGLARFQQQNIGRQVRTEQLQAALEESSGKELDDFFDFWIHGGVIPELKTTWSQTEDTLTVCILADTRHGRFSVPVVVVDQNEGRIRDERLVIDSGIGMLQLPAEGKARIAMDPGGFVLTHTRRVKKVEQTACGS